MIGAAVIASGFSRRMGRSKLTLPLGGRTFLERAVDAVCAASCVGRRAVVLRPEDGALHVALGRPDLDLITNPNADEGQSASIRHAARHFEADSNCEALIFVVVDQPFITAIEFERLGAAWAQGAGKILISTYDGQRGNPVLFAREFFLELQALRGDVGGRAVMQAHANAVGLVPMPDPRAGQDVDTWEEYEQLRSPSL